MVIFYSYVKLPEGKFNPPFSIELAVNKNNIPQFLGFFYVHVPAGYGIIPYYSGVPGYWPMVVSVVKTVAVLMLGYQAFDGPAFDGHKNGVCTSHGQDISGTPKYHVRMYSYSYVIDIYIYI